MSHRDRSIANMRCEAKRIYNQRRYINKLEKDKKDLQGRLDKVKIEISSLMSRYFYEKDFCIEDTHLDKILQMLDGGEDNE